MQGWGVGFRGLGFRGFRGLGVARTFWAQCIGFAVFSEPSSMWLLLAQPGTPVAAAIS